MTDYPHSLDTRPLTAWPGELTPAHKRTRSNFSAGISATLSTLTTELHQLGARHPVLEVAIPEDQWRIGGRPRANAREVHPGVVLSLPVTTVGALRYATDTFDRWQDNLRAIALGLEALRKVDRYGITKRGEQYAGFKAIGSGIALSTSAMTVDEAARALVAVIPQDLALEIAQGHGLYSLLVKGQALKRTWWNVAKTAHPDRGGDPLAWHRLEQAKRVLETHSTGRPA